MGIHGLHPFLRKKCPDAYTKVHLSSLRYKKVAVDVSLFLYKYKAIFGDEWLKAFLNLIMCLRRNGVHCVFIYDTGCCQEKLAERERRKEGKDKLEDKTEELKYALDEYARTGEVLPVITRIMKRRKVDDKVRRLLGEKPKADIVDVSYLERYLVKLLTQNVRITKRDIENSKEMFRLLSVPFHEAELEAETLCAILANRGIVYAALSEDTDLLAYGCTVFLHGLNTSQNTCMVLRHADVIEKLKLSREQFTDLCIMCGTDYNPNIPKIGPSKGYDLLLAHGTLDDMPTTLDTSCLKHERVRELFNFQPKFLPDVQFCGIPDWDNLGVFLSKTNCRTPLDSIRRAFAPCEITFED